MSDHLWQSTLCVGVAWLLTLALRRNRAAVRYAIWLAASMKFLLPFSLLVSAGSQLGWRTAPPASMVIDEIAAPFASPVAVMAPAAAASQPNPFPAVLLAVWLAGVLVGIVIWTRSWRRIGAAQRAARPLPLHLPIPAMSSPTRMEPGIFGIRRPVLLLPEGITDRLTAPQLDAVLAHELCHARRQDNLTGAIHMVVETIFWFHPLVWWIRARLVEERERACDEGVLAHSGDPNAYAEGILNVCKFYLEAPLACVSGITGADLKKRIEAIMAHRPARRLGPLQVLTLIAAAAAALAGPIAVGLAQAPATHIESQPPAHLAFDVASVKANHSGRAGYDGFQISHGSLTVKNVSLKMLISAAYGIQGARIDGGPAWLSSDRYDIVAKGADGAQKQQVWLMLRSLLASRFQLAMRTETKELPIYALEVGKSSKLPKREDADCEPSAPAELGQAFSAPCGSVVMAYGPRGGHMLGRKVPLVEIADAIAVLVERPVVERTGLTGAYNVELQWTPEGYQTFTPENEGHRRADSGPPEPGPSIFAALQEQMGLKLAGTKGPVEVLVIDRAEKPSEN